MRLGFLILAIVMVVPPKDALRAVGGKRAEQGSKSLHAVVCSITHQSFTLALLGENANRASCSIYPVICGQEGRTNLHICKATLITRICQGGVRLSVK